MPITFPVQSATSSAQTVPTVTVWDYILAAGVAQANVTVRCILDGNAQTTISPATLIEPLEAYTTTDPNGYFSFSLVPTDNMSPANCTYTIITPFRTYQITVPSGGPWQSTAFGIIVNTPVALAPAVTGLTGPLTISSGGLTVSAGGASIAGGLTVTSGVFSIPAGGFSMLGPLTLTAAHSQLIPGATDFSIRDTGNANDNLLVSNAGTVSVRNGLLVGGSGVSVLAGGLGVTGGAVITGTVTVSSTLTVSAGGLLVTGNSTLTGTLGVTALLTAQAGLTVSAGTLTVTAGTLTMAAAASQIVPGATSFSIRNHANGADNFIILDAGSATLRGALAINGSSATVGAGTLSVAQITASVNGLANGGDVTGLAVTATTQAGRRVRIRGFCLLTKHTLGDLTLNIFDGATQLAQWKQSAVADATTVTGAVEAIISPAAASHTYKLQVGMSAGTVDAVAAATFPGFISMEDIGV